MAECGNAYCEEKGIHKHSDGFYYCDECIHEFVYDEHDPDPSAEHSLRWAENYKGHLLGGWSG